MPYLGLNYVTKNLIAPFLLCFVGFFSVIIIFQALQIADVLFQSNESFFSIIELFGLLSIAYFPIIIPFCLLFGILFGYGKMSSDAELAALSSFGISKKVLSIPAIGLALIITIVSFVSVHSWGPKAKSKSRVIQSKISKQVAMTSFQPGVFVDTTLGVILYAEDEGKKSSLENVFMIDKRNSEGASIVFSKSGDFSKGKEDFGIMLSRGEIHQTLKDNQHITVGFDSYLLNLVNKESSVLGKKTIGSLSTSNLKTLLKSKKETRKKLMRIEIHKRTALSLICIFFSAIGVLYGLRLHNRSSRGSGFFVSLVFSTLFWVLLLMSESTAQKFDNPYIVYFPCFAFFFIILGIQKWNKFRSIV